MKQILSFSRGIGALALVAAFGVMAAPTLHAKPPGGGHGHKGNAPSFREIERQILARMRGMEYLGPEKDSVSGAFRFKFIKNGRVYFVDVDARTGRIIGQSH